MIGSHNTMTYLPVKKWWMHLVNWTAQCQNKTLEEQYQAGARWFDFRIRCVKGQVTCFAHGLVSYKGAAPITTIITFLNSHKDVDEVRIFAEDSCCRNFDYDAFMSVLNCIQNNVHHNVDFIICYSKVNGNTNGLAPKRTVIDDYFLFRTTGIFPYPRLHSKLFCGHYVAQEADNSYLVIRDFI